VSEAVIGNVGF